MTTTIDKARASEALIRWFQSQEIEPGDGGEIMAFTLAVILNDAAGGRLSDELKGLSAVLASIVHYMEVLKKSRGVK